MPSGSSSFNPMSNHFGRGRSSRSRSRRYNDDHDDFQSDDDLEYVTRAMGGDLVSGRDDFFIDTGRDHGSQLTRRRSYSRRRSQRRTSPSATPTTSVRNSPPQDFQESGGWSRQESSLNNDNDFHFDDDSRRAYWQTAETQWRNDGRNQRQGRQRWLNDRGEGVESTRQYGPRDEDMVGHDDLHRRRCLSNVNDDQNQDSEFQECQRRENEAATHPRSAREQAGPYMYGARGSDEVLWDRDRYDRGMRQHYPGVWSEGRAHGTVIPPPTGRSAAHDGGPGDETDNSSSGGSVEEIPRPDFNPENPGRPRT